MAGDGRRPEERATGLMMMMLLHFKILIMIRQPHAFAVATKAGVLVVQGAAAMLVQMQTGLAVGIIEAVVEVMIIIGVAMMTIINNNEGGEKVNVVDVVDVEKEDGEATDVVIVLAVEKEDHGGTMIIHGVDHSIEKNLGGKDAVLVEEASAVVPQQTSTTTWQQWVKLIYVRLNLRDMNMYMASRLY